MKTTTETKQERTPTYTMGDITLNIPDKVHKKIMHWMSKTTHEVSGFGSLDWDETTKTFTVRDAILLKQKVGPASTEIDPVSMGKAMFRMKDEPNALKWHWHSHVNMGVFWSADDRELITSLGSQGWILATVFNLKNESKTAFMSRSSVMDYIHDVWFDDLKTNIISEQDKDLLAQWDKEYAENVSVEHETWNNWKPYDMSGRDEMFSHWDRDQMSFNDYGYGNLAYQDFDHAPVPQVFVANDFDEMGFTQQRYKGYFMYNPIYDKQLKTEKEALEAVEEMAECDWEDLDFMREHCPKFNQLVNKYLAQRAGKRNGVRK